MQRELEREGGEGRGEEEKGRKSVIYQALWGSPEFPQAYETYMKRGRSKTPIISDEHRAHTEERKLGIIRDDGRVWLSRLSDTQS